MRHIWSIFTLWILALPAQAAMEMYYIHNDHLGTPRMITDANRQVVWKGQMKPFGEVHVETEEVTNHRRFPGQYYDIESGLHYNYFRDYDPTIGRYFQSDPIGLAGGLNTYAYVANNPVQYSDPLGLHPSLLPGMMSGEIPTNGLQMTIGVFGCGIGCASFMNNDSETQASLEATIGGGFTVCFSPKNSPSISNFNQSCEDESRDCGLYDPNCDNEISLPSLSPPGRFGYLVSGSKHQNGGYCVNIGPHIGLPLPGVRLGGMGE